MSRLPKASSPHLTEGYIPALTGLRALAAYLVFLHHHNPALPGTLANSLFNQGYVGVSIFFVLSGFLIYHQYANAYLSSKKWSYRKYLYHRFVRIYPIYILLLLVTVGFHTFAGRPMRVWLFMLNLTLLKGLFESTKFSGLSQSWSLTVEVCFYGVAPLLFTGLQRWGVFRLTVGLIGVGLVLWLVAGQVVHMGSLSFFLFYTLFGRSFEFVIGMALARQWQSSVSPAHYASRTGLCLIVSCVCWQTCVAYYSTDFTYLLISEIVAYNGLLPIGIALFLAELIGRKTVLLRLFAHQISQALGRSSYAFYLIHVGVVANGLQKLGVANYGLLFGALVGIAHALYHFVERPLYWRLIRCPATR